LLTGVTTMFLCITMVHPHTMVLEDSAVRSGSKFLTSSIVLEFNQ